MSVVKGSTSIGIEMTGTSATVPSNCWARLMYYLNSVNSCLKDDGEDLVPRNLRDCKNYHALSNDEKRAILAICAGPLLITNLIGKILFLAKKLDGYSNRFLKITETTELVALGIRADRVIGIGGSRKEVTTIMLMTEGWATQNFIDPFKEAVQSFESENGPSGFPCPSSLKISLFYSSEVSSKKSCQEGACDCLLTLISAPIILAYKLRRLIPFCFLIGLVIMGYLYFEISLVHSDQRYVIDASSYSSWPNNTYTFATTLKGKDWVYLKVYFDSNGVNQTANALAVATSCSAQANVGYARGRYSWWYRQYKPPVNGITDLLSEDSFVYFRFNLADPNLTTIITVSLTGVHSTSGSTDWTTIQWVQQLWFYGLFSLGTLLVVIPGCIIYCYCSNNE